MPSEGSPGNEEKVYGAVADVLDRLGSFLKGARCMSLCLSEWSLSIPVQ